MKYISRIVKRVIVSFGLLYAYNIMMQSFNLPIPINIYTISITAILGIPGFVGLILFYLFNFM